MNIEELQNIKFAKRKKAKDYLDESFVISHLRVKEEEYAQLNGKEAKVTGYWITEQFFFLKIEVVVLQENFFFAWEFVSENCFLVTQHDKHYKISMNSGVYNFFVQTLAQISMLKMLQDKEQDKKGSTDKQEKILRTEKHEKVEKKEKKHRGRPAKNDEARKSRMELRLTKDEKKLIKEYLLQYNTKHQTQYSVTDLLVKLCSDGIVPSL